MKRFRIYFNIDAEKEWLNKLCEKGWAFQNFFLGIYTFKPCKPGEYKYEIDLLEADVTDSTNFKEFMEENDVEVVSQWFRWVYLRKQTNLGPFELYTDKESLIKSYTRIRNLFLFGTVVEILCSFSSIMVCLSSPDTLHISFLLFFLLIIFTFIRMVWVCQNKIYKLKQM